MTQDEYTEDFQDVADVEEVKVVKKSKVNKPKIKLDFIIKDLKDLIVLTNRFYKKYGVTLKTENKTEFVFEGKTHLVKLKKV